jgi:hypothetical protein
MFVHLQLLKIQLLIKCSLYCFNNVIRYDPSNLPKGDSPLQKISLKDLLVDTFPDYISAQS